MLWSDQHDGVVSLWLQAEWDGRFKLDAIAPRQDHRVLFREHFTDEAKARAAWRNLYADLFGHYWEY